MAYDVRLGRWKAPTILDAMKETLGATVETVGSAVTLAERRPRAFDLAIPVRADWVEGDHRAVGARLRRQVRALVENRDVCAGGLWFSFSPDGELDGWLLVGGADLSYGERGGPAFQEYRLQVSDCAVLARRRSHRPGRQLSVIDRRVSSVPRDTLGKVFSTDFAGMSMLAAHYLGPGATEVSVEGGAVAAAAVASIDGDVGRLLGRADLEVAAYEQSADDERRGGVVAYDRRGVAGVPPAGQVDNEAFGWEEIFGADQPLTAPPVVGNGVCRARWETSAMPGVVVDAYRPGTGWVEQGRVVAYRNLGAGIVPCDVLAGMAVRELTADRAVIEIVVRASASAASRERVLVTVQRGWRAPRLEMYMSAGGSAVAVWVPAQTDGGGTMVKQDAAGAAILSASGPFAPTDLGAFTGENWAVWLRPGQPLSPLFAVLQDEAQLYAGTINHPGFGGDRNALYVFGTGYLSVHLGFGEQHADQRMEAEAMDPAAGTTVVADAAASGGQATRATRVALAAHAQRTWGGPSGTHRVFARVRTQAATTLLVQAGAGPGAQTTSTAYTWLDLGEVTVTVGSPLVVQAALTAGAGEFHVDRVELARVESRSGAAPTYDGARDLGQMALCDCRQVPAYVAR